MAETKLIDHLLFLCTCLFRETTQCAGHNHFSMMVYSTVIQSAPRCHLSTYIAPTQLYLNTTAPSMKICEHALSDK